jgi:type IV secretion system protein VirD4
LLDEFPSLGWLEFFESALAFMAGYGLKAFLIAQSLNQLEKAYGQNNSILDNCHVRVTYAANDDRTARRISDLFGQATEKRIQKSWSGRGMFLSNRTESEQEYGRALLMPGEVTQLPADDALLLMGGSPYRGKKVRYFLDPRFRSRFGLPPPDDPREQARELLQRATSDWDGCVVRLPAPRPSCSKAALSPGEPRESSSEGANELSAGSAVWDEFFASADVPSLSREQEDSLSASAPLGRPHGGIIDEQTD